MNFRLIRSFQEVVRVEAETRGYGGREGEGTEEGIALMKLPPIPHPHSTSRTPGPFSELIRGGGG